MATIARRASTRWPFASSVTEPSVQRHVRTGASSTTRSPSRSASRIGISCEPPTTREWRQRSGSKRLSTLPAPAITQSPPRRENVCAGLVMNPPARKARSRSRACSSLDLALQPCLVGDRVELGRVGVVPGRLRVERGGERVELRHGFRVGPLGGGAERGVVPGVAVCPPVARRRRRDRLRGGRGRAPAPGRAMQLVRRRSGTERSTARRARSPARRSRCSTCGRRRGRAPRARPRRGLRARARPPPSARRCRPRRRRRPSRSCVTARSSHKS